MNPNVELAARRARMDMADGATAGPQLVAVQEALAPDVKSFRGSYLLYRQRGKGMERMKGDRCGRAPRFRHPTRESAETEAGRLLDLHPEATFIVLQEVGRVKLKAII
jgi:hypothetical protein